VLRLAFTADYLDDTRPASFLKSDQRIKKPGDLSAGSATLAAVTGRAIHPPSKTGLSVAGRGEHRCGLAVATGSLFIEIKPTCASLLSGFLTLA